MIFLFERYPSLSLLYIYHSLGLSFKTLKLICSTNPFLHGLSGSFWTAFMDLEPVPD